MPNYMNTFTGGPAPRQQGVNSLIPQQQGQANQPKLGQPASQLGQSVGLNQQPRGLNMQQPNANAQGFYNNQMRTPPKPQPVFNQAPTPIFTMQPTQPMPSVTTTQTAPTTQTTTQIPSFDSIMSQVQPAPDATTGTYVNRDGSSTGGFTRDPSPLLYPTTDAQTPTYDTRDYSTQYQTPTDPTRSYATLDSTNILTRDPSLYSTTPTTSSTDYVNGTLSQQTPVLGFAGGGAVPSNHKDRIVKEAQMAVAGKHPNARAAIAQFENVMGTDATNDLIRAHATGGRIRGSGGGVDDLVPGSIDGREDVRLASGEYVIPARVVSALGDGDTERGSEILDDFVARVRAKASEAMMGSEPINAEELLPKV